MIDNFLLQCPEADAGDLGDLLGSLVRDGALGDGDVPQIGKVHPFDGQVVLETLLPLTTAVLAIVRTWIRARYDLKKSTIIMQDGDLIITRGVDPDKGIEILQNRIPQKEKG
jgi:hypothetical protein